MSVHLNILRLFCINFTQQVCQASAEGM